MKYFALLALAFAPLLARAEPARFTTVFFDDEGVVYVGVKHGTPAVSEVVSLPFSSGERTNIPLPPAIAARDVIGLVTEKEKLFVLTVPPVDPSAVAPAGAEAAAPKNAPAPKGKAAAKADGPTLHYYDRDKGKWKEVGHIACPAFTKVTLKHTQMIFSCEVGKSRKGKTRIERRAISLRRSPIYRSGVWRFPEFLLRFKGRTAMLEGPAPIWDHLRLRNPDNSERVIRADDLLQLPLPGGPMPSSVPQTK